MQRLSDLRSAIRRRLLAQVCLESLVTVAVLVGVSAVCLAAAFPSISRAWPHVLWILWPIWVVVRSSRERVEDADLDLLIDRRLDAECAIVTASELRGSVPPMLRSTVASAERILARARAEAVRPKIVFSQAVWLLPVTIFLAVSQLVPTPRVAPPAAPRRVTIDDATALLRIEQLPIDEPDPARRAALEEAAEEARALREALAEGMDPREALEATESIRQQLRELRRGESPEDARARDAALEALASEPELQRAVANRDLEALDRAVERAAARREAADRARARDALRAAEEAARREGGSSLADSLLQRQDLLDRRAEQAALARELAEAMPELAGGRLERQLERLEREGNGSQLSRETVDAMTEAWSRLTPEERQALADRMQRAQAAENREAAATQAEAGRPPTADEIEQQLRDALANLDRLEMEIGQNGLPVASSGGSGSSGEGGSGEGEGEGEGEGSGDGSGQGSGEGGDGSGTGGPGPGGGRGPEGGHTRELEGDDGPLARVRPRLGAGAPSETTFDWIDPSRATPPGEIPGGATGAPTEGTAGAIERAPIPEDYREHVRTYFGGPSENHKSPQRGASDKSYRGGAA